jgi:two-component system, response regulator PdtaR
MARVFTAEDELLIAEDLKHKLRRLGHTVIGHANTGEASVQKAIETKPELVLMTYGCAGR